MRTVVVRTAFRLLLVLVPALLAAVPARAQTSPPAIGVPRLIPFEGALNDANGQPRSGSVLLVVSLYERQDDPGPLWVERQAVALNEQGRYSIVIGAASGGVPSELFGVGAARWLGLQVEGEPELARVQLFAVPYAVAAASLDGKTANDFVLANTLRETVRDEVVTQAKSLGVGDDVEINGTPGKLVKFDPMGFATADSVITETAGGNIGINAASPGYSFQIHKSGGHSLVQLTNSTTGSSPSDGAYFGVLNGEALFRVYNMENDGIMFFTNHQARLTLGANGNVGIGTTSPSYLAQLHSGTSHSVLQLTNAATGAGPADGTYFAVLNGTNTLRINNQEAGAIDLFTSNTPRVTITPAGSVGVGTLSPQEMFHVTGNARIDGNIAAKYQDVAEWVEAGGALEPGTVVVVDPKRPNAVVQGNRAYDTRVAGAVSPQPGILLGDAGPTRVMVAQSGRVRIKVDARNGPIRIGDLLVTSPRAGYAMRSRPVSVGGVPMHRPGTVLGKALESLDKGTGEILVLLTLQ